MTPSSCSSSAAHRSSSPLPSTSATDRPKLTDFDRVRAQDSTGGPRTGMLGTVVYAAPEAMERAKEAGVAADVFGLRDGAVRGAHASAGN